MSIVNEIGNTLAGQTGTGNFVGANTPTLITPVLGVASATSISFSSTSGIIGTTTNNAAAAGSVGEFVFSQIPQASAISLSTDTPANVTSISLTAGDWDVFGTVVVIVANGTSFSSAVGVINTTSASLTDVSTWGAYYGSSVLAPYTQAAALSLVPPTQRFSLSGTTTIYLIAQSSFSVSTVKACGIISARRVR